MTFKIALLILIFGMVLRATVFSAIVSQWPDAAYYADHLAIAIMFGAIAFACAIQFQITRRKLALILGNALTGRTLALSALVAILLLMATFGESAVFTMAVAQYDVETAYTLGNYHPEPYGSHAFFSAHVLAFILCGVIAPAIVEELFFRGIVFRSLHTRHSFFTSAALTAALFTSIHFSKTIYLSTFLFSLVLSYLYATTRSLRSCMVAHATFNLLAFINQHYIDFHRIRRLSEVSAWQDWIPQLAMLGITLSALAWMAMRAKDAIKHASLPALHPRRRKDSGEASQAKTPTLHATVHQNTL